MELRKGFLRFVPGSLLSFLAGRYREGKGVFRKSIVFGRILGGFEKSEKRFSTLLNPISKNRKASNHWRSILISLVVFIGSKSIRLDALILVLVVFL